jgi:hypothetical protein
MTNATEGIQMKRMAPTWKHEVFPGIAEAILIKAYLEAHKEKIVEEIQKAQEAEGKVIVEVKYFR